MRYRNLMVALACCFVLSLFAAGQETSALPLPDPGNVTLTLAEYNHLIELAAHPPKNPELAPLPFSIQHADLKLRVEKDAIRGTVELDGEVLRKGISKVPLTSGMTILDARLNGKGVPLIQENGTHAALLPTGGFSIALDAGLPLRIEAGRASFTLPAPAAGSVQVSLVIPGDHSFANVTPGLITARKSENGHTVIEATLVPGQPANFWWATREVVAPVVPRETRFLADTKTLLSVSEAEMRVAVLADVTVVQGDPAEFQVMLPAGYEITGVTGSTLDASETQSGVLTLKVNAPNQRSHQFLISMERSINDAKAEAPFLSFQGAQRETGEVLVEGAGTMEITAKEAGGLKRMDVKEANPYLRSMARFPARAAFRYHRQPNETPSLALAWVRFPDSGVLAAVAESAQVTTLVTSEGKSLTEIKLMVKNQAQPFLKVGLAAGASILSAEVAGERVKPVQGVDGSRIPLLRPGFRPTDSYTVSFVFMHSGAPFAKKGGAELSLPSMDIPINLLSWEVFLPEQYKVKDFGGDVIAANRVSAPFREDEYAMRQGESRDFEARMMAMPADRRLRQRLERSNGRQRPGDDYFQQRLEPERLDRFERTLCCGRDAVRRLQSEGRNARLQNQHLRVELRCEPAFALQFPAERRQHERNHRGVYRGGSDTGSALSPRRTTTYNGSDPVRANERQSALGCTGCAAECLRQCSQPAEAGRWRTAGAGGRAPCGNFVRLRAAAGARRGHEGDLQLQEPLKS